MYDIPLFNTLNIVIVGKLLWNKENKTLQDLIIRKIMNFSSGRITPISHIQINFPQSCFIPNLIGAYRVQGDGPLPSGSHLWGRGNPRWRRDRPGWWLAQRWGRWSDRSLSHSSSRSTASPLCVPDRTTGEKVRETHPHTNCQLEH